MSSKRPAMIGSVIREVVAPLLRECPRACGIVSLAEVEVSADLAHATCYVSALAVPDEALAFLASKKHELQSRLARALQIHRIPQLRFRIDPRAERGTRLDQLLQES